MNPITLPINIIPDQSPSDAATMDIMINDVMNTNICITCPLLSILIITPDGNLTTFGAHRAVADIFCPNFWKKGKFEAHHIDGNKMNNNYHNIILLPLHLHAAIHKIKKMVLFKDNQIIEYKNPLDLVYDTGLKLEDILLANKSKKKPLKSQGGYTVFNVKGYLIGFKYYPETRKKK